MYKDTRKKIYEELGEEVSGEALHIAFKDKGEKRVNQLKGYRKKTEFEKLIGEFGEFYFLRYENILKGNIGKQMLTRSIYLCTLANYDGILVYGNAKGENKFVKEKDLQEILGLGRSETMNTKRDIIKENKIFLVKEDKTIMMNPEYFLKGKVEEKKELKGAIRVFKEAIEELYKKSKPREHKRLALLIDLLPYVNFTHNVICNNPSEKEIERIDPLTLKEVMEIAEYSNVTKFKKELLNVTVNGELAMKITETKYGKFIYVNPRVYYKGGNFEDLKACSNEFRIKKNKGN